MDSKAINELLRISDQTKNSWDHICFKKCMDTFEAKITPEQHSCLSNNEII